MIFQRLKPLSRLRWLLKRRSKPMDFAAQRQQMVQEQLLARGIRNRAILEAFRAVPRHLFVAEGYEDVAYADTPLPIPAGQTISQPYVVAYMIQILKVRPEHKVLEIGAGSGYAAAILSRLVREVYSVERHEELVEFARRNLATAGYDNVFVHHGDGTLGWPEHAPYDGIIVAASGPAVPPALQQQLAVGGRLIMPTGEEKDRQNLVVLVRKSQSEFQQEEVGAVRFVPLIGKQGW